MEAGMSIMMNLFYRGHDGSARAFAEEMERSGTADLIRKEDGNEGYSYFISLDDPETVLLIDIWRDQEALDRHHGSEMMRTVAALREKYDLHMTARRCIPDSSAMEDSPFIRK